MIPYLPPRVKVFWQISARAWGRDGICYNLFRLFSENPLLFRGKCAIISSVKNRMPRHLSYRGIAQLVEYWSPKPWVVGSSPSAPAKKKAIREADGFFQRCVPLARNVMCPWGVMFASQVMCASRVRGRNTSHHFALKAQYITMAKP